jgi:hypothetical protein
MRIFKLIAVGLLVATPGFAAASKNPGTGVRMVADNYPVHANATVSSASSVIITGLQGRQVDLIVNAKGTFTGSPSLTYTLQEVDPGDLTTVIGTAVSGAAITVAATQTVSLPGISGDIVKVSWAFTGTSITQVYATLRAKSFAGLVGQTTGARSLPVVMPSDWVESDVTSTGAITTNCASINSCGAGSTVSISQAGMPGAGAQFSNASATCSDVRADVQNANGAWTNTRFVDSKGVLYDTVSWSADSATYQYGIIVPMGTGTTRVRCAAGAAGTSTVSMRASFALGLQAVVDLVSDSTATGTITSQCTDANINSCGANQTAQIAMAGQFGVMAKLVNTTFTCTALKADFSTDALVWKTGLISDDRDNRAGFLSYTADSTTSLHGLIPPPGMTGVGYARLRCAASVTNSTAITLRATFATPGTNSYSALGRLRVSAPSGLFMDPFDGGTVDVTDRWTSSVNGAGAAISQTGGVLTIATTTTASARANLVSKPTFVNSGGDALHTIANVKIEASPVTNVDRFWGWATLPGTPTFAAPVTDGIGFKLNGSVFTAVVYNAGSATTIATLTLPSDGLYHRYLIARRSDFYAWYVDNFDVPVATSSTVWPAVQTLPITFAMANNTSVASGSPTFLIANASSYSDTPINMQLSDGDFPWKQAKITAKGVQASLGVGTQELKDAGRVSVMYTASVASTATAETLITLTKSAGLAATSTCSSCSITSGKKFRIQGIYASARNSTGTVTSNVTVNLRAAVAGATTASSPLQFHGTINLPASAASVLYPFSAINNDFEIDSNAATNTWGMTITHPQWVTGTQAATFDISVVGYEY